MFFAATRDELVKARDVPDTSVKLADGGYIAALGVYHELHCVVRFICILPPMAFDQA
jgi:hypothetical protein